MRVGISLFNFRPGCMGGIETYYRELMRWIPRCAAGEHEVLFFIDHGFLNEFSDFQHTVLLECSSSCTVFFRLFEAFTPYQCKKVQRLILDAGVDVMFFPHQAIFPLPCPVRSVITVHDLQHLHYPRYFSWLDRAFRATVWEKSLSECDKIIAISNATAKSLKEWFCIDPQRISVVHHGTNVLDVDSVDLPRRPDTPYYYYPAASYPHKGHLQLVQSFSVLKRKGHLGLEKLVFTGMKTSHWNKIQRWIDANGMDGEILHYGYVPYAEVLSLYKGAKAILFPTQFEGFGIPVLEAIQFEKKIICSRLDVFSEIGVPFDVQIDFEDPRMLLSALSDLKETKLEKAPLTWEETVRETLNVIVQKVGLDEAR